MAPGPEVAVQTPTSPVNLACAQAMNAASSLVRCLHETDLVFGAVQRPHHAVDSVSRIPVDVPDSTLV